MTNRRLFFGFEVHTNPPFEEPVRCALGTRYLTLAFLGSLPLSSILKHMDSIPPFSASLGFVGICDHLLFLKEKGVAYAWKTLDNSISDYFHKFQSWLSQQLSQDFQEPLYHVTVEPAPFDKSAWQAVFQPHVGLITALHLYESLPNLTCIPQWTHLLIPPFQIIQHTADVAFRIHATTYHQLWYHAQMALCFEDPLLLKYVTNKDPPSSLDEIIIDLNRKITRADLELGIGLKAVSFHGKVKEEKGQLSWEMVIDV